jgi:hypothetical protein
MHRLGKATQTVAKDQGWEVSCEHAEVHGREVGDDRVDASSSPAPLCCALMAQEEIVKMVTSPEDTSVRKYSWNFCEVTSSVPTDPTQGFDHVRKDGDFSNLGFNDSVILRIIVDVQKGKGEDHSSTQPGKMSMLGSRLATPRRENRGTWMIASLFQDAMLCTHRASEPKYLPPVMGGTGVTALFDNANNIFLYLLAYKGGTYSRIYATATAELRQYLFNLERGINSSPVLCQRLREKQEYFWGTYDNYVFVPKSHLSIKKDGEIPTPLYTATGGSNRYQNYENRLVRTRHVLTRRAATVEWEHSLRLRNIFLGLYESMEEHAATEKDRKSVLRAQYDNALNANSALSNLLRREASLVDLHRMLGDKSFHTLTVGQRYFTREDAMYIYLDGQGENYSFRDVTFSEDIFVREEVSSEETFKVGGIPLRPILRKGGELRPTQTRVGLYQINSSMEEWSESLLSRLQLKKVELGRPLRPYEMGPICDEDPEWVNDDRGLIARCHRETSSTFLGERVALISGDRRLANQMAETCNVIVFRYRPKDYIAICLEKDLSFQEEHPELIEHLGPKYRGRLYLDTGSLAADASHLYQDEDTDKVFKRTVLDTGWENGSRFTRVSLVETKRVRRLHAERHEPVLRPRIWRSGSRPYESAYSSHSSWRHSLPSQSSESSWWGPRPTRTNPHDARTWRTDSRQG